jgi:hypothetical protein
VHRALGGVDVFRKLDVRHRVAFECCQRRFECAQHGDGAGLELSGLRRVAKRMRAFAEESDLAVADVQPGAHPVTVNGGSCNRRPRVEGDAPEAPQGVFDDRGLELQLALVTDVRQDRPAAGPVRCVGQAIG